MFFLKLLLLIIFPYAAAFDWAVTETPVYVEVQPDKT